MKWQLPPRGDDGSVPVLVTGGTGTLGRLVVRRLLSAGYDVRVISRHDHDPVDGVEFVKCDLRSGEGVEPALGGAEIILHLAGAQKGDIEVARNLAQAASSARVRHLVFISVIGADRVPLGYFRSKLAAEQAISDSGTPWTTLRAAQFHDFINTLGENMAKLPLLPAPTAIRFQPVDADEVAARLVELALGRPAGLVRDLPGPTVYPMKDLLRSHLRASGRHRLVVQIPFPGKVGAAYRNGDNLSDEPQTGLRTWEEFLENRGSTTPGSPGRVPETPSRSAGTARPVGRP